MNTTIVFLKDEQGDQQVINILSEIISKAEVDKDYQNMAHRITQAFKYLKDIGVPPKHLRSIQAESLDGFVITLDKVVKELCNHPPLMELRVNWNPVGAFRAIFFYFENGGHQKIIFTQAVIKEDTFSQPFEDAVRKSEVMLKEYFKNNL